MIIPSTSEDRILSKLETEDWGSHC